jgi:hypothetical protein
MRWEMWSGSLWILFDDHDKKLACVTMMNRTGEYNAMLLPPREGSVIGAFPTLEMAKDAVETAAQKKRGMTA